VIAGDLPLPQQRALERRIPYRVHAIVTHTCNLACDHCYQAEHRSHDLTLAELSDAFAQMAAMGTTFLVVGGGEPLARRDIWEVLGEARRQRFAVELYTNGMLVDAEGAARLKQLGIVRATISVHGADPRTHDRFVGRAGSLERIERGIDHLERAGVPVMVRSNATRENHREIKLLELRHAGRPLVRYGGAAAHIHARDDGDMSALAYRMSEAEERAHARRELDGWDAARVQGALDRLARASAEPEERHMPCQAARTYFALHPNGDVTPCTQTNGHVMGNVRQRPLAEIWAGAAAAERFRAIDLGAFTAESPKCAECRFRSVCSRCPALSEQHSGSLTGWNPQTCQSTIVRWTELLRRARELGLPEPA
jgi:pyrroloquinoline quinone biosynthesis protein E